MTFCKAKRYILFSFANFLPRNPVVLWQIVKTSMFQRAVCEHRNLCFLYKMTKCKVMGENGHRLVSK